jgi:Ca2+-binding EF-hand superfamily protein
LDSGVVDRLKKYKSESFLKTTVMSIMVKELSSAETKNLREQFETFDKDKNGFLDCDELHVAFES